MSTSRSELFSRYARWVTAHRLVVILSVAVATLFLGSRLGSLQVDSNPDLWAPQEHPYIETTNLLEEVFGGPVAVVRSGGYYHVRVDAQAAP